MLLLTDQISLLSYHTRSNSTQTRHACTHDILGVFVVVFFPVGLWWDRRTNGRTDGQTDTVPFQRSCSAYYAGSANKCNYKITRQLQESEIHYCVSMIRKKTDKWSVYLPQCCRQNDVRPVHLFLAQPT